MKPFSLLIKPVSADCNLNCRYCYYRSPVVAPGKAFQTPRRMSPDILQALMQAYMQTPQTIYSMIWHGGEPMLLPSTFYEHAVSLQKRYARKGARISNSIQTNGVHVSEKIARFMAKYRFLCGVSLDGPAHLHDIDRRTKQDRPTHEKVVAGIHRLTNAGVPVNLLVLVSQANVHAPLDIYHYLKTCGFNYIQFIPCVEMDADGRRREYAITGEQWGDFLLSIFNAWFEKDVGRISIRLFESILAKKVHGIAIDCYSGDACNRYLVVEYNGDVYPCDFFVRPQHRLGNIFKTPFEEILTSERYQRFASEKTNWSNRCASCRFMDLCMGDCPKFRGPREPSNRPLSLLCGGWQTFFSGTIDRFQWLSDSIRNGVSLMQRIGGGPFAKDRGPAPRKADFGAQ